MDISSKKIIKKTTPGQFRMLVESMDEFPELATSSPIFGKSKSEIEGKWDIVAQKVNAAGPPMRNGSDWKKIWSDMKCRTKAKISENTKHMRGTGGGPSYQNALTDLEKDIDRICQLSIAAAPGGICFGTNSSKNSKEPVVLELTPPTRSTTVDVVTPTTSGQYEYSIQNVSSLSPIQASSDAPTTTQATSTPVAVMPNVCKKLPTQKKRKMIDNNVEESQEVKLLKLQIEQNSTLVTEMKAQTRSLDSMADSFRGIEHVLKEILMFLKDD